jgi:NAD(P)-dependent dehydrogenase (short-subunit alcohol dehydrogenase family)
MSVVHGKRIVIAGGATGIGAATALRLANEGARVVLGDLDLARAEETAEAARAAGGSCVAREFDLADEASVIELVESSAREMGGIDGLFNNGADLSPETFGRDLDLLEMSPDVWRRTFEVNLLGFALTSRAVIPHLLAEGGGAIVNTSSGAAFNGLATSPAYAATKAGVLALTRHVATRWGKEGVRCNALAPGLVMGETQLRQGLGDLAATALQYAASPRLGEPADLAGVAAFLFSDDAFWINGQSWSIDGGMTMR